MDTIRDASDMSTIMQREDMYATLITLTLIRPHISIPIRTHIPIRIQCLSTIPTTTTTTHGTQATCITTIII